MKQCQSSKAICFFLQDTLNLSVQEIRREGERDISQRIYIVAKQKDKSKHQIQINIHFTAEQGAYLRCTIE